MAGDDEDKTEKTPLSMMYYADIISKFDGNDKTYSATQWVQDIEDNSEIYGWTAKQKLIIARRSLTGTAEKWVRTEKTFKTFDELKATIVKEFQETLNVKEMHELMASRKKQKNESYYEYMLTMKELGKRAKFPDYAAIQYIIDGIPDHESCKTILYGVTTYAALKEKLAIYENIQNKRVTRREKTDKDCERENVKGERGGLIRRCYNCGEHDHVASSCKKGIKCFRCNSYGHIGTECDQTAGSFGGAGTTSAGKPRVPTVPTAGHSNDNHGGGGSRKFTMTTQEGASVHDDGGERTNLGTNECNNENDSCQNCQMVLNVNVGENVNKSTKIIELCGKNGLSLIDSGSDLNLASTSLFFELGMTSYERKSVDVTGLGAAKITSLGTFYRDIFVDGHSFNLCFYIVPQESMPHKIILGQPFLAKTTVVITNGLVSVVPQLRVVDNYPTRSKEAPFIVKYDIPVVTRPRRSSVLKQKEMKPSDAECTGPLAIATKEKAEKHQEEYNRHEEKDMKVKKKKHAKSTSSSDSEVISEKEAKNKQKEIQVKVKKGDKNKRKGKRERLRTSADFMWPG